ncbi:Outer membrane receptor proteins, mostly Fe transport [Microbulbifer donghaiensis]|uniref:Outer membrane receptor proteins, mostly Fe transport n=1 Tax=Microbulbifer donghaiensis TaxID=494016 RepID=A0A1M5FJU8_9GAMM|nr:TonB-dependent receptor [Microbulbifer donghaiensis]SHF91758.1 Outer membrane receptor proteins, mostly Fe transport [Microbulbifer donghaiensis]
MKEQSKQGFSKKTLATAVAAVSAGTLLSMPQVSLAQEAALEEVIVTATRRAQSVQDIPYNISAVAGDDLEASQVTDSAEMMRSIAGLTVVDRGYRNSGTVNGVVIRGMNIDTGANGDVPLSAIGTVATYIDDTPLYANFVLKDIERVEVLRGPQGTLYGSGSLAGTVRYIMNKPQMGEFAAKVGTSFSQTEGSDGYNLNSDVMVNLPLGDRVAFRANIGKIDNDGIVDYANVYALDASGAPVAAGGDIANGGPVFRSVEDADTVDITYSRASILFEPTDNASIQLSYQQQEDDIGGRRQVTRGSNWVSGTEQAYDDYENGAVILEPSEREVDLTSLEVEVDMGFATLTSSTADYSHSGTGISDNSGFYATMDWFEGLYYGTPRPVARAERFYEDSALVQEIRLVSNATDAKIDWILGFYYMDQDSKAGQNSTMPGWADWTAAAPTPWDLATSLMDTLSGWAADVQDQDFYFRRNQNFVDKAVFGEATINFTDTLRLTLGMRSFENELVNESQLSLPIWPFLGNGDASFETKESDTLFKGNLSWDISDSLMSYATVSEGYRRGGANAVPTIGFYAEDPGYLRYDSDSVVNYEFGLKGSTDAFRYTVSAFYTDWKDPQLNAATPNWGFFAAMNGDSARVQGIEFELDGYLSDSLHYNLGYTFVDGELTADFVTPTGVTIAEEGERLPSTAENTFSVAMDYTTAFSDGIDWVSRINGYYQSDSENAIGSGLTAAEVDAFQLWGVNTSLVAEKWVASLFVKNLFNEDGVTGLITERHMGTDPSENFLGNASKDYISLPRTIGLSGSYSF